MSNQENQHLEPWVDLVKTSHERLRASAARFLPSVESITQAGAWPRSCPVFGSSCSHVSTRPGTRDG